MRYMQVGRYLQSFSRVRFSFDITLQILSQLLRLSMLSMIGELSTVISSRATFCLMVLETQPYLILALLIYPKLPSS